MRSILLIEIISLFIKSTIDSLACTSSLHIISNETILSETGVQRGDPHKPVLSALAVDEVAANNSHNKGVRIADKTYLDHKMIANQLTPPPMRLTGDKSKRQLKLQFHQLQLTGTPSFTPADTKEAIRLPKSSTAIGPDVMSTLHLEKLAQGAINYPNIFNMSISTGQIPEICHKAIIIPI